MVDRVHLLCKFQRAITERFVPEEAREHEGGPYAFVDLEAEGAEEEWDAEIMARIHMIPHVDRHDEGWDALNSFMHLARLAMVPTYEYPEEGPRPVISYRDRRGTWNILYRA